MHVVQDEESGLILQTTAMGHVIQITPEIISSIIDVPVLPIFRTPFIDNLELPSIEDLRDFCNAHP